MELGEQIAVLREDRAMTQAELAEQAKIAPSTLSQIESGKVPRPHVSTVRKIARALGVEPQELRSYPKVQAPSREEPTPMQAALEAAGARTRHLTKTISALSAMYDGVSYKTARRLHAEVSAEREALGDAVYDPRLSPEVFKKCFLSAMSVGEAAGREGPEELADARSIEQEAARDLVGAL